MPTSVFFGEEVLERYGDAIKQLGQRALVVTGRTSAVTSGAMNDFETVAKKLGLTWVVYNKVSANPTLDTVAEAVDIARKEKVDFVVGIGGGSPLDTAKAIALLTPNKAEAHELYLADLPEAPLPIATIPTTSGTGSEVTQYAVFTLPEKKIKKGFGDKRCFPQISWVDPRYTYTLPYDITVDTALDALTHSIEGYLNKNSTPVSDELALAGIFYFAKQKDNLLAGNFEPETRSELMYASTLGGMVIAQTRTTVLHSLGYPLTYSHDIPHGRANGLLLAAYLEFIKEEEPLRVNKILNTIGMNSLDELKLFINKLLPSTGEFSKEELERMAALTFSTAGSLAWTPRQASQSDLLEIYRKSL